MRNKYLIILMSLIIIFNFISIPKSYGAGVTLVAQYGLPYAEKLIAFLYGALAVGVTFNAVEEAEAMLDKWLIDEPNWEPPQDSWKNLLQVLLVGGVGVDAISNLFGSIKDWIQELGATEGDNTYLNPDIGTINGFNYTITRGMSGDNDTVYISINGGSLQNILNVATNGGHIKISTFTLHNITHYNASQVTLLWSAELTNDGFPLMSYVNKYTDVYKGGDTTPIINEGLKYNVKSNSSVISGIAPTIIQPNVENIPNVETQIDGEGKEKLIYPGTLSDLTDSVTESLTWEDYVSDSISTTTQSYTITETQSGTEIQTGTITEVPFENPTETPIPESELEGQKSIIVLLKSIINWISQIPNLISKLFVPTTELTMEPIKNIPIAQKWPFSIPFDLLKTFTNLRTSGEAPKWVLPLPQATGLNVNINELEIDFVIFNPIANLVRILLSILFLIGILVLTWKVFI